MGSTALLKKLGSESIVYGLSGMVTRFISVFLTPIYTAIFAPADYGVASLVITLSALLNILLILSLDNSMARWFYDSEDEQDRNATLNTFLWSCLAVAALLALLVIVFRVQIAEVILRQPEAAPLLALMGFNLPLGVFSVFTTNVLRMQRRAVYTAVFTLVTSLANIALSILLIVRLDFGLYGIFYAQIGASIISAVWSFAIYRQRISPTLFDLERWKRMFAFSMPLIPGTLAFWVLNLSGAYFIQLTGDASEVGLFQIGSNIASGMVLFTGAFQMAWGPFAYSIHKRPEAKQTYAQSLLIFVAVTASMSLCVMLFAPEILMVLTNPNYYDAAFVAGLLAFNHVIIGVSTIASIGPGIAGNNKAYGAAMVASAIVLVALNFLLVPRYGKEGAATSMLISQSLIPIAVFLHGQKLYPIPYKFGKAVLIAGASFLIGTFTMFFLDGQAWTLTVEVLIKTTLVVFYGICLALLLRNEVYRRGVLTIGDLPS